MITTTLKQTKYNQLDKIESINELDYSKELDVTTSESQRASSKYCLNNILDLELKYKINNTEKSIFLKEFGLVDVKITHEKTGKIYNKLTKEVYEVIGINAFKELYEMDFNIHDDFLEISDLITRKTFTGKAQVKFKYNLNKNTNDKKFNTHIKITSKQRLSKLLK